MSHPLNESSLSSTVAHSKHLLLMHEAKTAHTRDEITENLQSNKEEVELSPQMKMMQDIVNSLPEGLLDTKIPVVIASKKKEQK